jgi:formylglycine-generating enzyme required for sulfatase activity
MYFRSFDGVVASDPATVSTFALDEYEVTVGRFRRFAHAWLAGWTPTGGVHSHLNGGLGLVDSSGDGGTYEPGWSMKWNTQLPPSTDIIGFTATLQCDGTVSTWSDTPGSSDELPITCVPWYWAYAFCIWDGGFLPSEAEWEYAAAGGGGSDGQRVYAWSNPPTSSAIDCSQADYAACGGRPARVGALPAGAGKWGQLDLTGNVSEWTLDFQASYVTPCTDCAFLSDVTLGRSIRGGGFGDPPSALIVPTRNGVIPQDNSGTFGIRCARSVP